MLTFCFLSLIKIPYFQCIVFTVGDGGFNTESFYDYVIFEDLNSDSSMLIIDKLMKLQIHWIK